MINQSVSWHWVLTRKFRRGDGGGEDPAVPFPWGIPNSKGRGHRGRKADIHMHQKTEIKKYIIPSYTERALYIQVGVE